MAFTRHGHHINGTPMESGELPRKANCGGPAVCSQCALDQANTIAQMFGREGTPSNPPPAVPATHNTDLDCPSWCPKCREEAEAMTKEKEESEYWGSRQTFPDRARQLVFEYAKKKLEPTDRHITFSQDEVYVVWFSYTLGNWKALVSTTLPDQMYYEVTYNITKGETYLDAYKKWDHIVHKD